MSENKKITANQIWEEHEKSISYKNSLGEKGLFTQTGRNEKFYIGDQWLGNTTKSNLPLVVYNIIKRIGEYKLSQILSNPLTANFSAEGISSFFNDEQQQELNKVIEDLQAGNTESFDNLSDEERISLTMSALTDYFKSTCERVKFNDKCSSACKNAYISGTGAIYVYWDSEINTGLFADSDKKTPIKGDINIEVLNAEEQLDFHNPSEKDLSKQDYIIISKKMTVAEAKRIAEKNGVKAESLSKIKADSDESNTSYERDKSLSETVDRVTVLTRLFKVFDNDDYKIMAIQSVKEVIIREEWDTGLKNYPISLFRWEEREKAIFGESEITYLIPNQIAVNRMTTASVWSAMLNGMPIMLVDRQKVTGEITNQPGQIWEFNGDGDMRSAATYIQPPQTSTALSTNTTDIINNTLQHAGANDAALGNLRSDNATAISVLRDAATAPMQLLKNRYYQFVEDIVRICAEFWFKNYGDRKLKICDKNGNWYLPFNSDNYSKIVFSVQIDVGASAMWSTVQAMNTLDNLLSAGLITFKQYLERIPNGLITDVSGLIKDIKEQEAIQKQQQQVLLEQQNNVEKFSTDDFYSQLSPEEREAFDSLNYEEQKAMIEKAKQEVLAGGQENVNADNE